MQRGCEKILACLHVSYLSHFQKCPDLDDNDIGFRLLWQLEPQVGERAEMKDVVRDHGVREV